MKRLWLMAMSIAFVGIGLGLATIPACSENRGDKQTRAVTTLPNPADAVSEELLLSLHNARNLHHIADVHVANGKLDKASAAVRRILSLQMPAYPEDAEEAEVVKLDARARLAKLLVLRGKLDDAMKVLDVGIAAARRESFFLANVYTVKGEVFEAMAALARDGDPDRFKNLSRDAVKAYARSITINETLQKKLMKRSKR